MDTTKLDDLLNQAEAQESEQSQWIEDINYITKNFYVDEHGVVEVKDKTIGDMSKHISVKGESYSQYIEFKIGRFFDGIDLTKMKLAIYFNIPNIGEDESRPINVYYNENEIKFGWVIPPEVAQTNLTIEFCIYARGKLSDGNDYVLKTKTATYQINDGLEIGSGIIKPTNNWYLNFVLEMDEKVSQASESADRAEQAASSVDGVVETVTTARDDVAQKASTVNTQHSEVENWHQESEQFRNEAEQFRNQAEAITGIGLAEEGKPGIVQPDGVTTKVDENGKLTVIGGGGGGGTPGTTDYEDLDNKPSIAGVELNGDKSYDELGIASKDTVARNFETVNQNIQELDDYTQSLGEDIVSLDTELQTTSEKLVSVENELQKTTTKVDTIIEKADLGIKETASGEEIHLTDSAEGKAVEFALYGKAKQNTTSGKNLLSYPYFNTTKTMNGITFTDVGDGTVVANGTATADAEFVFKARIGSNYKLSVGSYIVSGCPSGGSNSTYKIRVNHTNSQGGNTALATDYGSGYSFEIKEDTLGEDCYMGVLITIFNGAKVENLVFKPMIRLASITDDTYEPYTNGASPNPSYPQEIEVSGESYNLLPYPYSETSKESNGITFMDLGNGEIVANGTASATTYFTFNSRIDNTMVLEAGEYIVSGCAKGGSDDTYRVTVGKANSTGAFEMITKDIGNGATFTLTEKTDMHMGIEIKSGITVNNIYFKPMIRKASVKNDRYMPYGKGSVEVKSVGKNLIDLIKTPTTVNGITVTPNGDGTFNASGTATKDTSIHLYNNKEEVSEEISKGGSFAISLKNAIYDATTCNINGVCTKPNTEKVYLIPNNAVNVPIGSAFSYILLWVSNGVTIDLKNVGIQFENNTTVTEWQPYKETKATIPTENGLAGIKVSSGGNYTDQNGQQWICDEVVKYADGSGAYIKRIEKAVFDGVNNKVNEGENRAVGYGVSFPSSKNNNSLLNKLKEAKGNEADLMSTYFASNVSFYSSNTTVDKGCGIYRTGTNVWFNINKKTAEAIGFDSDTVTYEQFNTWLQENPITVYGILAEPITTPLTAEEIAEISTFYPVTNISNDFDCGMKIEYVGDSIITTNTEIPIVEPKDEEELESGDNIVTLFGKIKKKLKNVGKGVVDVVDNLLSTSTTLPLSANQGRVLDEKISTINESLEELGQSFNDISNLINEQLTEQISNISTRLSTLEQNQKTIIYSDTEPETVEENTIVMVYETEE